MLESSNPKHKLFTLTRCNCVADEIPDESISILRGRLSGKNIPSMYVEKEILLGQKLKLPAASINHKSPCEWRYSLFHRHQSDIVQG